MATLSNEDTQSLYRLMLDVIGSQSQLRMLIENTGLDVSTVNLNQPPIHACRDVLEAASFSGKLPQLIAALLNREAVGTRHAAGIAEILERSKKAARQHVIEQAGNRCAVCGHSPPLVLSHITARVHGGESSEDNLIALCPNCQTRADMEAWDADTLRQYKEKPWVERRVETEKTPYKKTVQLTLSDDVGELDRADMQRIAEALAKFLETSSSEIEILQVRKG